MNSIQIKMKRGVIFLYYLLLWFPPIILATIAIYYSADIYKYFFYTRTAPIKGIIESQDEIQFYMNPKSCLELDGETEYATFGIQNPNNKGFRFLSNDPTKLSLMFDNGTLFIEKFPADSTETISYSQTITDSWKLNLLAEEASIVPSSSAFRVYANICDSYFIINDSEVRKVPTHDFENSGTNIFFTYFFENSDQEVQITIDNASDQDGIYKKVQITFLAQDYGSITVESQGRILDFSIPSGKSNSDPSNLNLYSFKAQGIRFINPSGYVNIDPEGIIPFQVNDDESVLVLQNNDNNRVFSLSGAGGSLVLSGLANSIEYRNIELLHSRWQLLSPELQASIVAASLAAIGYLVVQFSPRIYIKYVKFVRRRFYPKNKSEISDKKIIVPNGYEVFKLSDGGMVAGKLVKKPDIFRQSYTISNVYLLDDTNEWHKGPKNLVVHKRRIIYHFVKTEEY